MLTVPYLVVRCLCMYDEKSLHLEDFMSFTRLLGWSTYTAGVTRYNVYHSQHPLTNLQEPLVVLDTIVVEPTGVPRRSFTIFSMKSTATSSRNRRRKPMSLDCIKQTTSLL